MTLAGLPGSAASGRGAPAWARLPGQVGLQRWASGIWVPADETEGVEEEERLAERFLAAARNPLGIPAGRVALGLDDLGWTPRRPRHEGLDLGARILGEAGAVREGVLGVPVHALVPGGYFLPGANRQRTLLLHRHARRRFRAVVEISYQHLQTDPGLPGAGAYAPSDPAFLRARPAASQPVGSDPAPDRNGAGDHRIVGYEAYDWIPTPRGPIGCVRPGEFRTMDRDLRARGVGKGAHLHLEVRGLFDRDPDRRWRFLNEELVARLGYRRVGTGAGA